MKLNKKIIIVLLFIIGIAGLLVGSIAYYRIVVSGNIEGSTGNAVFALRDTEAGESWNNKVISLGQINPGDSGSFDVVMDASGSTVDMYATLSIDRGSGDTELPTNLKFYTTSDHKSELHKYYSFLEKSGTNKETLTIYWYWNPYIDDVEDTKYINKSFNASINVSAVQISEYARMKNGHYAGSSGGSEFWNKTYKNYIRTITFGNDLSNLPSSCTGDSDLCWDVSYTSSQKKKVYAYLIDSGLKDSTDTTKSLYNLYIVSDAPIFAPYDCSYIFYEFKNLTQINFNNNFNTSKVTDMENMFYGCSSLVNLDLSSFNTSKVTTMEDMFANSPLTRLDLSNFNTSKVTNMYAMFSSCTSLTELDLSSFNTSLVTIMMWMFNGCKSLTTLDLNSFNTSKVTNMREMFRFCSSLTSLDLSSFNTSEVIYMGNMFDGCRSLTNLDIRNFNTSNVTNMAAMFEDCSALAELDLSRFNTSSVIDMGWMFLGCQKLTSLDLSSFNTVNVTNMESIFSGCSSLTNLDLSNFNTSNVTDMGGMFNGCSSLEVINLDNLNMENVINFRAIALSGNKEGMFQGCTKLSTTINIVSNVATNYGNMFYGAATSEGASIIVNYIADASDLVDNMIATKSSNSNIIKGSIIPEYSITISGNDDIKYERISGAKGAKVTLTSISGNNYVTSFKMNGILVNGNEFYMPGNNVTITDIVTVACKIIETAHNPYPDSQRHVVLGEYTFENAKSLTVILNYQTEGYSDCFYIYDSSTATSGINNNKRYYSSSSKIITTETITINSNYIKIEFSSNASRNNYYGLKAIVIPNY